LTLPLPLPLPLPLLLLWPWLLLLTYRVPFRSGGHRGEKPEGRRTWMYAVRGRGRMPLPRIPVMDADPERAARRARRQGALSFGYLFFARAKKSNSPARAKAFNAFAVATAVA
ncbi:hypothetical protein J7373_02165, partial [Xanthomonas sp. A2111]|uniref:hypothetical protein n=1 Tax=Xanthomonas hawaiiensis TaxID=3003247 RepID=UPI001ADB03EA